ncbi:cupin domain-containing protein [Sharpea porci]|uniref:hypothetical protein n=1 Tax=Sharpea porci TaxID=2652286 RepID=UPI001E47BC5A|nr:hypothetical protein [Sharpea porci]
MLREVIKQVKGYRTQDGAGVSLVRVLGNQTVDLYDPFLMLDAFDSTDPNDYIAGFPMREFDSCLHFFTNQIAQNVDYINAFEFFYCQIFEIICSNT